MTHLLDEVRRVADDELLSRLERLVKADRALSVKLLVHLGEVEARKLYLERGYSSMYGYCMTALGMSEAETYLRLLAAKTGKRLPLVLERLAEGGLHLTAIKLLAPLLTDENHVALLDRARGMSKREVELLVAELAPKADVPELMRKLPESRDATTVAARRSAGAQALSTAQAQGNSGADVHAAANGGRGMSETNAFVSSDAPNASGTHAAKPGDNSDVPSVGGTHAGKAVDSSDAPNACGKPAGNPGGSNDAPNVCETTAAGSQASAAAATFVLQPPRTRSSISPLSPGRFKLELTLGQEAHDQLEQLRELFRHQNPSGEITSIVERALRELLERTLKRRFAQTASPRRQGTLAREPRAVDGVREHNAAATDADAPLPARAPEPRAVVGVRERHAALDARAHRPARAPEPLAVDGAKESAAAAADAPAPQLAGAPEHLRG
jgi:hypothetical protein